MSESVTEFWCGLALYMILFIFYVIIVGIFHLISHLLYQVCGWDTTNIAKINSKIFSAQYYVPFNVHIVLLYFFNNGKGLKNVFMEPCLIALIVGSIALALHLRSFPLSIWWVLITFTPCLVWFFMPFIPDDLATVFPTNSYAVSDLAISSNC